MSKISRELADVTLTCETSTQTVSFRNKRIITENKRVVISDLALRQLFIPPHIYVHVKRLVITLFLYIFNKIYFILKHYFFSYGIVVSSIVLLIDIPYMYRTVIEYNSVFLGTRHFSESGNMLIIMPFKSRT